MSNKFILFILTISSMLNVMAQTSEAKIISDKMILVESKDFINTKSESIIYGHEDNLLFLYIETLDRKFLKPLYTINEFNCVNSKYISLVALNEKYYKETNYIIAPNALAKATIVRLISDESDVPKYYYKITDNYISNKSIKHPAKLLKSNNLKNSNIRMKNSTHTYYIN